MEQDFEGGVLQQSRVHFLGARGIEAMVVIDHARGNQATLRWLLYGGRCNLVQMMTPGYALSGWQWRGVWGERTDFAAGRGYCANLGHPEDETGLVYMRARYYEPATGRFLSEDPSRDGVNWYLYADGNPISFVDFDGRIKWLRIKGSKYFIRIDKGITLPGGRQLRDAHWGVEKGGRIQDLGSIWQDGRLKHGDEMPPEEVMNYLKEIGFFGGNVAAIFGAINSLDAYFRYDPFDFLEILMDIGGLGDIEVYDDAI